MDYLAYHFTVTPAQPGSEILSALMADRGFESFEQGNDGFTAYIRADQASAITLDDLSFPDFIFSFRVEKIAEQNWNQEWEKNFEPVVLSDLLCIRAPFHESRLDCRMEVVIMPKMSFGTGHHQTTRLVCRQLFETDLKGKTVLDMGCGTGVLAILAAKLGATSVTGVDSDEWSVENAVENCLANSCDGINILFGDSAPLEEEGKYDVILANINRNVLKKQMKDYARLLRNRGVLIMSGFFTTDVDELQTEASNLGLLLQETTSENEWAVMRLGNRRD